MRWKECNKGPSDLYREEKVVSLSTRLWRNPLFYVVSIIKSKKLAVIRWKQFRKISVSFSRSGPLLPQNQPLTKIRFFCNSIALICMNRYGCDWACAGHIKVPIEFVGQLHTRSWFKMAATLKPYPCKSASVSLRDLFLEITEFERTN